LQKKALSSESPNWYYEAERYGEAPTGGWGGLCTCPNGETYDVGDNFDSCGSLACVGGTAGECVREDSNSRKGMKVRCDTAPPDGVPAGSHGRAATRFLSWNIYYANNLMGRAGEIASAIVRIDPEIVSLQELWHEKDRILEELNRQTLSKSWEFARGGETEKTWDGDILYRSDLWQLEESGMRAYGDRGVSWAVLVRRSDGAGVVAAGALVELLPHEAVQEGEGPVHDDVAQRHRKTDPTGRPRTWHSAGGEGPLGLGAKEA